MNKLPCSQRDGSTQASVQKDEPFSAVKDDNKQVSEQTVSNQNTSKQLDKVPNDSQPTNSTDDSQTAEERVPDDIQADEERVCDDIQATISTARGSLNSQQLQSIAFLRNVLKKREFLK